MIIIIFYCDKGLFIYFGNDVIKVLVLNGFLVYIINKYFLIKVFLLILFFLWNIDCF